MKNITHNRFLILSTLICLVSAFLSFLALDKAQRFHPDEAFYMTFARNASVNGDWLLVSEPVDKTPLTFYTNALALILFAIEADENGVLQLDALTGELAGRMPSVLMSVILVAVGMQLAQAITKNPRVSLMAGLLMAVSPLRIVFAPTAFTDLPMLLCAMLALWMAVRKRSLWAGIWFAISLSAKPQVIFYAPLIIAIFILKQRTPKKIVPHLLRFMIPVISMIGLLWGWDSLRIANGAESFYLLGQSRYTITQFTPLSDYPHRLMRWWQTNQYVLGHAWLTAIGLVFALILTIRHLLQRYVSAIILLLWLWLIAFIGIHIVLTLNLFDRNQLVLMPIMIIVVSWALVTVNARRLTISFMLSVAVFGGMSSFLQLPIGGDDGSHDGIDALADYLNDKPIATVIYDPWLDWELDYYMGQWTNKRRVYYPTPEQLVDGALSLDEQGTRYFIAPTDMNLTAWLTALQRAGFSTENDYQTPNFIVYRLQPPSE